MMRVIVNGAKGKMGIIACETIQEHSGFSLVGCLSKEDNLSQAIVQLQADIVIDVTRANCVYENALAIIESGARPVIGTSGLTEQQITELRARCRQTTLGAIIAPNFSLGAILMMRFAAEAASYLQNVEIIEAHHPQKFDAPSGTAKKTAALIEERREHASSHSFGQMVSKTNKSKDFMTEIPIHSVRLPGVLAQQQVIFGSTGETLTISHNSIDRSCFKSGIRLCCEKVMTLDTLVYGLETLL